MTEGGMILFTRLSATDSTSTKAKSVKGFIDQSEEIFYLITR